MAKWRSVAQADGIVAGNGEIAERRSAEISPGYRYGYRNQQAVKINVAAASI